MKKFKLVCYSFLMAFLCVSMPSVAINFSTAENVNRTVHYRFVLITQHVKFDHRKNDWRIAFAIPKDDDVAFMNDIKQTGRVPIQRFVYLWKAGIKKADAIFSFFPKDKVAEDFSLYLSDAIYDEKKQQLYFKINTKQESNRLTKLLNSGSIDSDLISLTVSV